MVYHHKSGSQKRKERKEKDEKLKKALKTQPSVAGLLKKCAEKPNNEDRSEAVPSTSGTSALLIIPTHETEPINPELKSPPMIESHTPAISITPTYETEPFNQELESSAMIESPAVTVVSESAKNFNDSEPIDVLNQSEKSTVRSGSEELLYNFDIGNVDTINIPSKIVTEIILRGHQKLPTEFPRDKRHEKFPPSLLFKNLPGGKKIERDWLVWSREKSAFFCLPCRLFFTDAHGINRSNLCTVKGYSSNNNVWKKLYDKLPSHENNKEHVQCYLKWRETERRIFTETDLNSILRAEMMAEAKKWKEILVRILDVILFLGERGLAFRGDSHLIGDPNNGNFLGILELISHYDPVLKEHLEKVKQAQQSQQRLQVHYLSNRIQNEFIEICAKHVQNTILQEREEAKYYSIIVDATPDSAHREQTTFICRYLKYDEQDQNYHVEERFLGFVNCNQKTGADIANLIREKLESHKIPLSDCRGQGYDNGSNMKGEYKGAQALILKDNPLATYSPYACHSLNLCGVDSAECCSKAITFFGVVQKCYTIFSSSPQRWEILKNNIPSSFHSLSDTRWSARIDAIKPFAKHLPKIKGALDELTQTNLTPEIRRDVNGLIKYVSSFECILMASIWVKVLNAINERNVILQQRNATIDVEIKNLESLVSDIQRIRDEFYSIMNECKLVASENSHMETSLPLKRKKKGSMATRDDGSTTAEMEFKIATFNVILDSVISGINSRFTAVQEIHHTFSFLNVTSLNEEELKSSAESFVQKYSCDVSSDLADEIIHLKNIYEANFETELSPLDLLSKLKKYKLESVFPNVMVALRLFCPLPVTVASGERSFSTLGRVQNFLRACSTVERTSDLAILSIEAPLAKKLNFDTIIGTFADLKARKAKL